MSTGSATPLLFVALLTVPLPLRAQLSAVDTLTAGVHALRAGAEAVAEWAETADLPHAGSLDLEFAAAGANDGEWTLTLRQAGVRRGWRVLLNGRETARLHEDENPMTVSWAVPAGEVVAGANSLRVEPLEPVVDDITVGPITLAHAPRDDLLRAGTLEVQVTEGGSPVAARVTIVDASGALQEMGARSGGQLAVRPGVVYTGDGHASIPLPAGR